MIEIRDNGDLVVIAVNGDPVCRLQLSEPALAVNLNPQGEDHPFNTRAEMLTSEDVKAIRHWCDNALAEFGGISGGGSQMTVDEMLADIESEAVQP